MASGSGNAETQLENSSSVSQTELESEPASAESLQQRPQMQILVQRIKHTAEDKIVDVEHCSVAEEQVQTQTVNEKDRNGEAQEEPAADEEPSDASNGLRLNERTILKLQEVCCTA